MFTFQKNSAHVDSDMVAIMDESEQADSCRLWVRGLGLARVGLGLVAVWPFWIGLVFFSVLSKVRRRGGQLLFEIYLLKNLTETKKNGNNFEILKGTLSRDFYLWFFSSDS
jgi:hypothetical protein